MKFKMNLNMWADVNKEELEAEGVSVTPANTGNEDEYLVEIESLEQAVGLVKKFKADLVITYSDSGDAFFFNGYYE